MKRNESLYGNCEVYSMHGKLMFRCNQRKINWYLKRGLAEQINDAPLSIRLNFQTNGNGEPDDVLKIKRENICVVCGEKDNSKLTKHHIVPYEFRKHFPDHYKSNLSILVIGLCQDCHGIYEDQFANPLKEKLFAQAMVKDMELQKFIVRLLVSIGKNIEAGRQYTNISKKIELLISQMQNKIEIDIERIHNGDLQYIESMIVKLDLQNVSRGYLVYKQITDFVEFSEMWFNDFVSTMKPLYMSPDLKIETIRTSLRERKYEKKFVKQE